VYKLIVIFSLFFAPFLCKAQKVMLSLYYQNTVSHMAVLDSAEAKNKVHDFIEKQREDGYLGVQIDTLIFHNDSIRCFVDLNKKYTHIQINKHNLTEEYAEDESGLCMNLAAFSKLQSQILYNYENNGYPFVSISLTQPQIRTDTLLCDLIVEPYIQFKYDTLRIIGNASVSKKYISNYLGIIPGKIYREQDVMNIDNRLQNLPIVQLKSASQAIFNRGIVQLILHLDDAVIDRFDGIVGIAPNSTNQDKNDLLVTGEINIGLNNLFQSGQQLELQWKNYLKNSQKLDISVGLPYLLNTKIGINGEMKLNKFDTLFVNIASKLAVRYQNKGNDYLQFYYQNINSNLLNVDTNAIRTLKRIPDNNPYQIDNYGLAIFHQKIDHISNPRKGFSLLTDVAIGQKTIQLNNDIAQMQFFDQTIGKYISLYDTLKIKHTRLDVNIDISSFIPIMKKSTIHQRLAFQGLFSDQIFFSELHNFGGFSTLKGFDENEFFASKLLRYTIEYRYLISKNSHIGMFFNMGAYQNDLIQKSELYDTPLGIGFICNLQVGQGLLNLAYALGSEQGNGFQLNTAKIHFGIINYF
jgi:hypothetical protein